MSSSSHPGLVVSVFVQVEYEKQGLQLIQERRPDKVPSNVAVKSPLSDVFSSMSNLVADHGTSDVHPKLDYCDKLQKQT